MQTTIRMIINNSSSNRNLDFRLLLISFMDNGIISDKHSHAVSAFPQGKSRHGGYDPFIDVSVLGCWLVAEL